MDFTRLPVPGGGFPQHMAPAEMGRPDNMMNPPMIPEPFPQVEGLYTGGATSTDADYREMHTVLVDQGDRFGVSTACFDDRQELLWMGNQGGHVTSYYGLDLQKYTSFQVHHTDEIRQIVPIERGILSLTQSSLKCSIRRGIPLFTYTSPSMQSMQCMLLTSPSTVLIGGHQTKVIELDLDTLQEIKQFEVPEPGCAIFRRTNKFLCAGDAGGKVTLYDPKTMKSEHVLSAHSGALSDFDLLGNLLVTCGFSSRHNSLAIDRFLMVYDMRVMRAMAPIQVIIDPMFLRTIPAFSNTMLVVSQTGQFQLIDTTAMTPPMMMYPINTQGGLITSLDVSSTCQALSFGDSNGYLHLFTTGEHVTYNSFSEPTEFADPVEHLQTIHITDELTPLSIIPMMYPINGTLLSDWPPQLCQKVYRKPKPIDPDIIKSMKMQHNVGYAPNPGKEKRNQVPYKLSDEKSQKKKSGVPESPLGRGDDPFIVVPKRYRKVDLKYSKLGLEDFDFRHYNKTHFAGLETNIPNSYCNCLLQTLFMIEPLRCTLLSHLCVKEFCLACELGFLFHMLDSQKGQTCQASNFLRAFRTIPEAAALGLILAENEENSSRVNLTRMIQSWQRFVCHQIHSEVYVKTQVEEPKVDESSSPEQPTGKPDEEKSTDKTSETTPKSKKKKKKKGKKKGKEVAVEEEDKEKVEEKESVVEQPSVEEIFEDRSIITDLFGIKMATTLRCRCGQETQRQSDTTLVNLCYPDCSASVNKPPVMISFAEVVRHSLTTEQTTQTWCNICERYQPHMQKKLLHSLPDILAFNCGMENARDVEFWKIQRMLLKQQKEESTDSSSTSSSPIPLSSNIVMCRYGRSCTRRGCKFRHEHDIGDGGDSQSKVNPDEDPDTAWVPLGLKLVLSDDGSVEVTEISDEESLPKYEEHNTKYYEVFATIAHIKDTKTAGNLVGQIKGGETYHQRKEGVTCTQWYLFNDFSITPIEKYEAIQFNIDWKVPCSIYFMRRNIVRYHKCQVVSPITPSILFEDSALVNPKKRKISFTPLLEDEDFPKKGDIVGLDAEFVSLNQEESELRSDGTRSMIKPSHLTVARISCIRGQGDKLGEPFIDDYISTQEQVVDYLTQFSGIQPGDLDPSVSTKHLTTLKSTYQKLRCLVQAGVVFVGHGLKKDFRVINITVPKDQVIDTVELFHLPRQRMISLKFLAWYFLNINIQAHTHDSVEDARTALNLYLKYKELQEEGGDKVRAAIKEMYEFGRKNQWKIPDLDESIDQDQLIDFSDLIGNG